MNHNQHYSTGTGLSFSELFEAELAPAIQDFLDIRKEFRQKLMSRAGLALLAIGVVTILLYMKWGTSAPGFGAMTLLWFVIIFITFATSFLLPIFWEEYRFKVGALIGYFLFSWVFFALKGSLVGSGGSMVFSALMCFVLAIPVGLIPYAFFHDKQKALYEYTYREIVVKKLVEGTDENAIYEPDTNFAEDEFFDSDVFGIGQFFIGKYKGHDLVDTKVGDTVFRFFSLYTKTIRRNKNMFQGVFLIGDLNREFEGSTTVTPNLVGRGKFGSIVAQFMGGNKTFIETDNAEFEKHFKAYSDLPYEAEEILSPNFMERMLGFREKISDHIGATIGMSMYTLRLNVKYQQVYMAFDFSEGKRMISKKRLFGLPKLVRATDFRTLLQKSHEKLEKTMEIMQDLNASNLEWEDNW